MERNVLPAKVKRAKHWGSRSISPRGANAVDNQSQLPGKVIASLFHLQQ